MTIVMSLDFFFAADEPDPGCLGNELTAVEARRASVAALDVPGRDAESSPSERIGAGAMEAK